MSNVEILVDDYLPTVNKVLSKREILKWCLSNNYKKDVLEVINRLKEENSSLSGLVYDTMNVHDDREVIHISDIEYRYGKAEYMNPISNKFKLYLYMPPIYVNNSRTGHVKNKYDGKSFLIKSIGRGYFVKLTEFNSYKLL